MTISTVPSASPCVIFFASAFEVKRDNPRIVTGKPSIRCSNVARCCCASSVVGTNTATCFPSCTALKAARTATSVLPYPTSPTITRSMGTARSMSPFTASMASIWSSVSTKGKLSSISRCHGESAANAWPGAACRLAYSSTSSPAISRTAARAFFLVFFQSDPPIFDRVGFSPPTYRDSMSRLSMGTYSWSAGAPRLDGAYSSTTYSLREVSSPVLMVRSVILTNRPMPCVS